MESISEQVADLEHALRLEREANEALREAIIGRGLDPDTIEADLDAVDRRLLEISGGRVALDPSPATGYAAPTPIEPPDDWERRRGAWMPDDDTLPHSRKALREIILEQRVELEAFRERCDAYSNELEGWRNGSAALPDDLAAIPLESCVIELVRRNRDLEAECASAPPLGSRAMANLEIDRDGWRSRAQALQARVDELEGVGDLQAQRTCLDAAALHEAHARLDTIRSAMTRLELVRTSDGPALRAGYRAIRDALDAVHVEPGKAPS